MQPTFIRLFADDKERGTEYLAISTITQVRVEIKPLGRGEQQTSVVISTLEGATRVITGAEAQQLIDTLDSLSPVLTRVGVA